MKNIFLSILLVAISSSCSPTLFVIHLTKNESFVGAADEKIVRFIQINNRVVLSQKSDWPTLRPIMAKYLEKSLFQSVNQYMSAKATAENTGDDWWIQRGIVYLSGNSPWRCEVQRERVDEGVITYKIKYWLHTSKESFGEEDPVLVKMAEIDGEMKIIDILFLGHPKEKGVAATRFVSIREWIKYAYAAGYLKN